jgi:hypothetical protein
MIREPLCVGFLLFTAGIVGLATLQPGDELNALIFAALAGMGFGAPLVLLIAGVQLSTPHHLIATATAATTCARAIAGAVFTAIYTAAFSTRIGINVPADVAGAALKAGLPPSSTAAFIGALTSNDQTALSKIPGVSQGIIAAGVAALKQAYADSLRVVFIIAAPFGLLACFACFFLGDLKKVMDYAVEAPVEDLHAKRRHAHDQDV